MLRACAAFAVVLSLLPATAQPPQPKPAADPGLDAVPTDAFGFVSVKVSKLWDNPAAKPFRAWVATQQKDGLLESLAGVPLADIDRVTVFMPLPGEGLRDSDPITLVTTREKYAEAKVLKALGRTLAGDEEVRPKGRAAKLPRGHGPFRTVLFANDRMLVFTERELKAEEAAALLERLAARKAEGILSPALAEARTHDIAAGVNVVALEPIAGAERFAMDKEFAPFLVLLKARTATLTADVGKTVKGKLVLAFPDAETAKQAATPLEDGLTLIAAAFVRDFERGFRRSRDEDQIQRNIVRWGLRLWKSTNVTVDGANVVTTAEVAFADDLAKFVAALPKSIKEEAINTTVSNNLKQLALGMINYSDTNNGVMPGDVAPGNDAPAMSWRVQILPYIEQDNLYRQLDPKKPWDDPANLKVLEAAEMPKVFEHPGRKAPKGHTYYRVFAMPKDAKGEDRPLFKEGERGPRYPAAIPDGTSDTFLVVEAGEAVPWYKPDVLAYDGKLPLPQLGAKDADLFLAAFCDGSVRKFKPSKLGEKTLRALITPGGGEVIEDLDR
jgi:hypothetical protein